MVALWIVFYHWLLFELYFTIVDGKYELMLQIRIKAILESMQLLLDYLNIKYNRMYRVAPEPGMTGRRRGNNLC